VRRCQDEAQEKTGKTCGRPFKAPRKKGKTKLVAEFEDSDVQLVEQDKEGENESQVQCITESQKKRDMEGKMVAEPIRINPYPNGMSRHGEALRPTDCISTMAPETWGTAMEVPEYSAYVVSDSATLEIIDSPGATISGFWSSVYSIPCPLKAGPLEEKNASASLTSEAPTAMTESRSPGLLDIAMWAGISLREDGHNTSNEVRQR
jgi:hypothetical protein